MIKFSDAVNTAKVRVTLVDSNVQSLSVSATVLML